MSASGLSEISFSIGSSACPISVNAIVTSRSTASEIVERFFCIIKHFRAIATRYEKTARNFLAGLHLVCAFAWLE